MSSHGQCRIAFLPEPSQWLGNMLQLPIPPQMLCYHFVRPCHRDTEESSKRLQIAGMLLLLIWSVDADIRYHASHLSLADSILQLAMSVTVKDKRVIKPGPQYKLVNL